MFTPVVVLTTKCGAIQSQTRGMATLKDISLRLKSVKNIQKITASMKMVSAAKFARAERELKPARPYGESSKAFYEKAEVEVPEGKPKHLHIAMSSDRGLCGGIHSAVVKAIRAEVTANPDDAAIVCIGDKSRSMLAKGYSDKIIMSVADIGKKNAVFTDAARIAQAILSSGHTYDTGTIYYNHFRSVVSYRTTELPIYSNEVVGQAKKLGSYDSLDAEVMGSYMEYSLASLLYYAMKEGATSEQSSRMTSMDNATTNAGEMISKLTLTYNRTRQAVITRELIEIISGAAAL